MSLITEIEKSYKQICLIEDISGIFEGIASIRIRQIKNRVVLSKSFFDQIWHIYHQLMASSEISRPKPSINKSVLIVITSTGGLSGEIDNKIIQRVAKDINGRNSDIIVFGEHGAVLLAERNITPIRVFKLPNINKSFDIGPVIRLAAKYKRTTVYYQTFVSLAVQKVGVIDLLLQSRPPGLNKKKLEKDDLITSEHYDFEPSLKEVVNYMESVMLGIALQQMMLESRLAQFASRFTAMVIANNRAKEVKKTTRLRLLSSRRTKRDEDSRQVIYSGGVGL